MITAIGRIIAFGCLLTGLFGCGASFDWSGQWIGERDLLIQPGTPEDIATTVRRVRLTIKPDGTFELIESGAPRNGLFLASGRSGTLRTLTVFGKPVEQLNEPVPEAELALNGDGTATLTDPSSPDGKPVILRREAQPLP